MKITLPVILAAICLLTTTIASAEKSAPGGQHLFILSGQSNMRKPLPTAFRSAVQKVFGEDKVIVVTLAHPSQPIRRWYKKWKLPAGHVEAPPKKGNKPVPNGGIYDALMKSVNKATKDKQIATVTYIWMQGEADAGKGWGEVYEESFYGVLDQIKADLKVKQVNYVLGRINDYWTAARGSVHGEMIRDLQKKIGEAHDHGGWVNTDDLNTGVNPWGIYQFTDGHFPPPAYAVLGERFARKACLLIDPDLKLSDDIFTARHFDSPGDIKSHAAIGAAVSGSNPVKGKLSTLTDGKFAQAAPDDSHWLEFNAAEGEVTELTLDLGKLRQVDQLGLSLLYHPEAGVPMPKGMTMETSADTENWQRLNRKNFSFREERAGAKGTQGKRKPQSLIALAPGSIAKGKPVELRYLRIRIKAPKVYVDEIIAQPTAGGS